MWTLGKVESANIFTMASKTTLIASVVLCVVFLSHTDAAEPLPESSNEYCNIPCKNASTKHVMCMFPTRDVAEGCQHYEKRGRLTEFDKNSIVNLHNAYRLQTALGRTPNFPPALDLKTLRWDFELEEIALHWAVQCKVAVPACIHSRDGTQNYLAMSYKAPWNQTAQIWEWNPLSYLEDITAFYEAYMDFPMDHLKDFVRGKGQGKSSFFVAIMNAGTERLGCARTRFMFYFPKVNKERMTTYLVCLYGPGHEAGTPLYAYEGDGLRSRGTPLLPTCLTLLAALLGTSLHLTLGSMTH